MGDKMIRLFFQLVLITFILVKISFSQTYDQGLVAWWQFEEIESKSTPETVSGNSSLINGFQKLEEGVKGKGFLF